MTGRAAHGVVPAKVSLFDVEMLRLPVGAGWRAWLGNLGILWSRSAVLR